ncbi:MAG: hypothetical protein IKX70_07205 [Treponema sp.]|nr:hypothetical protein [Treponema sp.]
MFKPFDLLRFIRFLIPVLYVFILSKVLDEFLFDTVLLSFLTIYFIILLISLFLSEKISIIIMIIIDSIVVCFFSIYACVIVFYMFQNVGEAGFGILMLLFYAPVYIPFVVFLVRDINKRKRMKLMDIKKQVSSKEE